MAVNIMMMMLRRRTMRMVMANVALLMMTTMMMARRKTMRMVMPNVALLLCWHASQDKLGSSTRSAEISFTDCESQLILLILRYMC